jgi:hypothetical protein
MGARDGAVRVHVVILRGEVRPVHFFSRRVRRMMEQLAKKGRCVWCSEKIVGGQHHSNFGAHKDGHQAEDFTVGPMCTPCMEWFTGEMAREHPEMANWGRYEYRGDDEAGEPIFVRVGRDVN